jgi:hypothetical protein
MKRAMMILLAISTAGVWAKETGTIRKIHKREINHTRAGMAKYGKNKSANQTLHSATTNK